MVFDAYIIIIHSVVHKSLLFRKEEKPVAPLVYSSFIRVANSDFRIFPYSLVVIFVFRIEDELLAILVYSSFGRVATSGFRIIPYTLVLVICLQKWGETSSGTGLLLVWTWFRDKFVATSSWGKLSSNEEWFRNHSAFTTALQHSVAIRMIVTSSN